MKEILERRARITGIGQSQIGRRLGRDPLDLTLDACLAAIEDAGLQREDIDGLATYPGAMGGAPGFTGAGIVDVQDALRLQRTDRPLPGQSPETGARTPARRPLCLRRPTTPQRPRS